MDKARSYTFLLLEDDESDVFLMKRQLESHLERATLHVAQTQERYEELVQSARPDLILSDYRLPRYSGIEALLYARKHSPMTPFVFVTGALYDEELAADTILQGASGFVLKNNLGKLWKLLPNLLDGAEEASDGQKAGPASTQPESDGQAEQQAPPSAQRQIAPEKIAEQLTKANPETLAKIQRLLRGEELA